MVADILKMTRKAVKGVQGAGFDKDGRVNEDQRAVCRESERTEPVAVGVPCAKGLYLAVREKLSLGATTKRFGSHFDCFVASCSPDGKLFEILKRKGL